MPRRLNAIAYRRNDHARQLAECFGVPRCDRTPAGQVRLQLFELREPKRACDIRQPVIEAQQDHFIEPLPALLPLPRLAADPVIAKTPQRLRQLRVVSRNHAAFTGSKVLDRMKAEHSHISNAPDALPKMLGAQSMAGILDENESVLRR